jgi:putative transposase
MNSRSKYYGHRFPPEIISHAVWLYHRYCLSFRDIEDLLAERNIIVSYESIRQWCMKFGPHYARQIRRRNGQLGDTWYMDEMTITTVQGQRRSLWRAVDQDDNVIEILLQKRKNMQAAKRFFRKMLKDQCQSPRRMITDKLKSYGAARKEVMPSVVHCQERRANNRAEASHQHTRQHERQMRRFKSPGQAQRFLAVHSRVHNLFRFGRHRLKACHYKMFRSRAFSIWNEVTNVF